MTSKMEAFLSSLRSFSEKEAAAHLNKLFETHDARFKRFENNAFSSLKSAASLAQAPLSPIKSTATKKRRVGKKNLRLRKKKPVHDPAQLLANDRVRGPDSVNGVRRTSVVWPRIQAIDTDHDHSAEEASNAQEENIHNTQTTKPDDVTQDPNLGAQPAHASPSGNLRTSFPSKSAAESCSPDTADQAVNTKKSSSDVEATTIVPPPASKPDASQHNSDRGSVSPSRLSRNSSRRTGSFQSALADPEERPAESEIPDDHEKEPSSESLEEDQAHWQDCVPSAERPIDSQSHGVDRKLSVEVIDVDADTQAENLETSSPPAKTETEACMAAQDDVPSTHVTNAVQMAGDEPDVMGEKHGTGPPSDGDRESSSGSEAVPEDDEVSEDDAEEETTPVVMRKRRGGQRHRQCLSSPKQVSDPKTGDDSAGKYPSTLRNSSSKEKGMQKDEGPIQAKHAERSAEHAEATETASDDHESPRGMTPGRKQASDVEFKAPKPRQLGIRQGPAFQTSGQIRQSGVQQTPKGQVRNLARTFGENQSAVLQKKFAVDEAGKVSEAGLGFLSEIASTPSGPSREGPDAAGHTNNHSKTQGARLFRPTNDIYSAQRRPALSRSMSIQRSGISRSASLLAHTPGAQAPTGRTEISAFRLAPSSSNLRESLAALKQPITGIGLRKERTGEELRSDLDKDLKSSLTQLSENDTQRSRGEVKRLTFADGIIEKGGNRSFSRRALEPQTAPTKDIQRPRIRRSQEKSALRRKIEELRGKRSFSTVTNDASQRSPPYDSQASGDTATKSKARSLVAEVAEDSAEDDVKHGKAVGEKAAALYGSVSDGFSATKQPRQKSVQRSSGKLKTEGQDQEAPSIARTSPIDDEDEWASGLKDASVDGSDSEDYNADEGEEERGSRRNGGAPSECNEAKNETPSNKRNNLTNLVSSISSFLPGAASVLGARAIVERDEETEAEAAAKRQRLDAERREEERIARIEAERAARQHEALEKRKRAESRRQRLAEEERAKEEERKRKEEMRRKHKRREEEQRRRKKVEEDRRKEEHRKRVLEKGMNKTEKQQTRRKGADGKRQRHVKVLDRSLTGIPKPTGNSARTAKSLRLGSRLANAGYQDENMARGGAGEATPDGSRKPGCDEAGEGVVTSYVMTPAKATILEMSDDEDNRRRDKAIPRWAGSQNLAKASRAQPDPDNVFVNIPMCNLRDVFGTERQYRTRSSSANWTKDRVTTAEMTRYRRALGGSRES